jgi:hypothetical protein
MADATATHPKTAPTLFISYASEDRAAAQRLRDVMNKHGIDVWYDADELSGGDAWDKKIRDRIRACDYFMPLISKATEARREGYFRREWRQAAERTLDMSDDMMFLLPVNIDEVAEYGARVPERFTQVQWTRCPGGEPNTDFDTLCGRILRGDSAHPHVVPTTLQSRPSQPPIPPESKQSKGTPLPPYPPQPKRTAHEPAWLHVFNLLVWIVRCVYRAYRGFPRILRWVIIGWVIVFLVGRCGSPRNDSERSRESPDLTDDANSPDTPAEMGHVAEELTGLEKLGDFGRIIGAVADAAQSGRTLAIVPFAATSTSPTANEQVEAVFAQLMVALRANREEEIAVSPSTLGTNPSPSDLLTRTARTESKFLLTGWIETDPTDQPLQLVVLLYAAGAPTPTWTGRYPLTGAGPTAITEDIQAAINTHQVFESALPASLETSVAPSP